MSQLQALIIDDDTRNLGVMVQLLAKQKVDSAQVPHPDQLSSVLATLGKVDVVFLDLEMPGRNGYEVLEALRANSRFKGVPIVAYSVHISEIDTAYQQGFSGFIGKPLDSDKFPDQLARILKGEGVWETA